MFGDATTVITTAHVYIEALAHWIAFGARVLIALMLASVLFGVWIRGRFPNDAKILRLLAVIKWWKHRYRKQAEKLKIADEEILRLRAEIARHTRRDSKTAVQLLRIANGGNR